MEDEGLRRELDDTLERCLADDTFAWELNGDGSWSRRRGGTRAVQAELMEQAAGAAPAKEADRS